MATNNWTSGINGQGYDTAQNSTPGKYGVELYTRYFDCSTTNMTGSDVYQVFKVEAGDVVLRVITNVATAEGGAATLDVGDGGSTARYDTDINLNATGTTGTAPDAYHTYTAADTIDIIPSATLDAAKFSVSILVLKTKVS